MSTVPRNSAGCRQAATTTSQPQMDLLPARHPKPLVAEPYSRCRPLVVSTTSRFFTALLEAWMVQIPRQNCSSTRLGTFMEQPTLVAEQVATCRMDAERSSN